MAPQRRQLGCVLQDHGLWPHMTVSQNVAFLLKNSGMLRAEIAQRIEDVL